MRAADSPVACGAEWSLVRPAVQTVACSAGGADGGLFGRRCRRWLVRPAVQTVACSPGGADGGRLLVFGSFCLR